MGASASGLFGVVNLALASLALLEEGAGLKLPRFAFLKAWLVVAYVNVGAVAFLLVCMLDTLKGDEGLNIAMAFGSVFAVITIGKLKYIHNSPFHVGSTSSQLLNPNHSLGAMTADLWICILDRL